MNDWEHFGYDYSSGIDYRVLGKEPRGADAIEAIEAEYELEYDAAVDALLEAASALTGTATHDLSAITVAVRVNALATAAERVRTLRSGIEA